MGKDKEMACVRCGIVDFDYDMVYQPDGKEYHKELGDCIKCQSERIDQLEKQLKAVAELHLSMLDEIHVGTYPVED
jgi:hypothetical protein